MPQKLFKTTLTQITLKYSGKMCLLCAVENIPWVDTDSWTTLDEQSLRRSPGASRNTGKFP